jgi:hypothetical protein
MPLLPLPPELLHHWLTSFIEGEVPQDNQQAKEAAVIRAAGH